MQRLRNNPSDILSALETGGTGVVGAVGTTCHCQGIPFGRWSTVANDTQIGIENRTYPGIQRPVIALKANGCSAHPDDWQRRAFRLIHPQHPRTPVLYLHKPEGVTPRRDCKECHASSFVGHPRPLVAVVMPPFQGFNSWSFSDSTADPEEVSVDSPSSSSIVTAGSESMMKWWATAPSGPEKLDDGEPRRSGKITTITLFSSHFRSLVLSHPIDNSAV
ncbi:hypothetical protein EVAR_34446_1 [Eumeta japonica]|uniref:Uncharacterized protein n=1 Tax=Eumeta variegata TaxID=151549 RepID=A0A4C1WL38_EUMVA|nr:hypothetical protein EVAR_34446_1 [Eumeta japonica]